LSWRWQRRWRPRLGFGGGSLVASAARASSADSLSAASTADLRHPSSGWSPRRTAAAADAVVVVAVCTNLLACRRAHLSRHSQKDCAFPVWVTQSLIHSCRQLEIN
jgi:hypothetical protein